MLKRLIFLPVLFLTVHIQAQITGNRPLPPGFPEYEYLSSQPDSKYMFITPFSNPLPISSYLAVLDPQGYIAWYFENDTASFFDFKLQPGNIYTYAAGKLSGVNTNFFELDAGFNLIDTIDVSPPYLVDLHEIIYDNDGNYVVGALVDTVMDLTSYTFGATSGGPNDTVTGFIIEEYDSLHNLTFSWNSFHHIPFDEYYTNYGYNPSGLRYCQGNAIEFDHDGNLLVSFRVLNSVYKIDRTSGNVIWRLGGKSSDFTFPNDSAFSAQHDFRVLNDSVYTVYDNGNMASPNESRVIHYTIDTVSGIANKVYEYYYTSNVYAPAMGGYHIVGDGYRLINWGNVLRPEPSITVLDSMDNIVTTINLRNLVMNYRAFRFDLPTPINRPVVTCSNIGPDSLMLSAPTGFTNYVWSNGDIGQTTVVVDTGSYQVWVNYGAGMAGSSPFHVTDLNINCSAGISFTTPEFAVYPNPFDDILFVQFEEGKLPIQLKIYDGLGKTIYSQTGNFQELIQLNLTHPPGIYLLELMFDKGHTVRRKILKQ